MTSRRGPDSTCSLQTRRSSETFRNAEAAPSTERNDISGTSVKGNPKRHLDYWKQIEVPKYIIDVIINGYVIPFITTPPAMFCKNNISSVK